MRLTIREVAHLLKVSEEKVYRWIDEKELPAFRINGKYHFNRAHLLEWATSNRVEIPPGLFEEPENEKPMPSLNEALRNGGILYKVAGRDKAAVLAGIVEKMPLPGEADRSFLLQMLMAREKLASTAVGGGIAIPHMRNPVVMNLSSPLVCLAFPERPVDYGALDGKPVHTLFTIVSPTIKTHLSLLSRLSFALRDKAFASLVARQAPGGEILTAAAALNEGMAASSLSEQQKVD